VVFNCRCRSPGPQCVRMTSIVKYYAEVEVHFFVVSSTFASTAPSPLIPIFVQEFGLSEEVGTLTVSLFVCGYCVGPLIWGPLSEQYGRRPIFIITFFIYTVSGPRSFFPVTQLSVVFSNWLCIVAEHCIHLGFPFPWRCICSCPISQFSVRIVYSRGWLYFHAISLQEL
jgi:MFS family permease